MGLLMTFCIAAPIQQQSPAWLQKYSWMMGVSMVATLATICVMSCFRDVCRSFPTNYIVLLLFTTFEGVLIGFVSAQYTEGSVGLCLAITAAILVGLTIYAWTTKTDFTGFGPYLFGALLSLCVFGFVMSIMGWFGVHTEPMYMVYDILGILLFVMYIIF